MTGRERFPFGASGGDVEREPALGGRAVLSASCLRARGAEGSGEGKEADNMGGEDGRARPALPPGRFVDLPGRGTTFVRELAGPEGAPAVLLLHGWTATADLNWHPAYRPLSKHFRVIALDHRGHGRGLRGRFRLEDCADDAAMLLEQLGVERCLTVGYSMGGPIAQLLHRRRPELVSGLVLCATSAAFTANTRDRLLCGLASSGWLLARTIPVQPLGAVALGACRSWSTLVSGGWWGYEQVVRHDWAQIIEAGRQTLRFDSRPWLATTTVPTAVIATDNDDLVPHARQLALAAAIPGATLRVVGGGHTACTEAPGLFVPALLEACLEVTARAAAAPSAVVAAA